MLNIQIRTEIILHFNKIYLQDPTIPMWVVKVKGQTYYVNHIDVDSGVGFSTKETPDNPHTKGSLKFKGKIEINSINEITIARIYP
jgi:hypothetical protein